MKQLYLSCIGALALLLTAQAPAYSQCELGIPVNGINVCVQSQLSISNTASTITVSNATNTPVAGGP